MCFQIDHPSWWDVDDLLLITMLNWVKLISIFHYLLVVHLSPLGKHCKTDSPYRSWSWYFFKYGSLVCIVLLSSLQLKECQLRVRGCRFIVVFLSDYIIHFWMVGYILLVWSDNLHGFEACLILIYPMGFPYKKYGIGRFWNWALECCKYGLRLAS